MLAFWGALLVLLAEFGGKGDDRRLKCIADGEWRIAKDSMGEVDSIG